MHRELEHLPIEPPAALRLARRLARAGAGSERQVALLDEARRRLHQGGLDREAAAESALLLLALGLRERGIDHLGVVQWLRSLGESAAASVAALESARIVRRTRPDLDPAQQEASRRRAAAIIFLVFAAWGALGVELVARLG